MDYYEHSGRFSPIGTLLATFLAAAIGGILGFLYAYLVLYIPLAGYVTFILTGGFGLLVGVASGVLFKMAKVRSLKIAALLALAVSLAALYASWATWVHAVLRRADIESSLSVLAFNPELLWKLVLKINEKGAWSLKGGTPTGGVLWFLWGIEALLVVGIGTFVGAAALDDPFCETCSVWCDEEKDLVRLKAEDGDELKSRLEARDWAYVNKLGTAQPEAMLFCRLSLFACGTCHETNTLTAQSITSTLDENGGRSESATTWVDRLLFTRTEADVVRALAKKLNAAPPPAPPAADAPAATPPTEEA